jgi:transcriptional regulator with XRE-family HTH domain
MSFGKRLLEARKKKGISQEELAKKLKTKGPAIGRYERDEMKPSIEAAAKIANILEVSLDYLVGQTDMELDKKTINRILELQKLPKDIKDHIFYFIDMSIRDCKAVQAYATK